MKVFEVDGTQSYLVFQPMYQYFKKIEGVGTGNNVFYWKSKGLSDENIIAPTTSDSSLSPQLSYLGTKKKLEFREICLKQNKIASINHGKIVNIYVVYEFDKLYVQTNPKLVNCLFGVVNLAKNADIDKYKYSGYGIGFGKGNVYPVGNRFGRNVIISGADMSSSVQVDNKGKDILILGRDPMQGQGEHSLTAEKMYSVNFTDHREKDCLILQYNGINSYLFINGTEFI